MGCAASSYQELGMAKKPVKNKQKKDEKIGKEQVGGAAKADAASQAASPTGLKPWLSFKTGLIIITVCSIGMGVLTAMQYVPAVGWNDGLRYAVIYGALVWGVFFISQLVFRWLRK
jgi:hypothetical protein